METRTACGAICVLCQLLAKIEAELPTQQSNTSQETTTERCGNHKILTAVLESLAKSIVDLRRLQCNWSDSAERGCLSLACSPSCLSPVWQLRRKVSPVLARKPGLDRARTMTAD